MDVNIKGDLSTLTTIDESVFTKLITKVEWCISDGIEKAILSGDNIVNFDIGIGILSINIDDNNIKYKFKPSQKLEKVIINTVENEGNSLILNIEDSLISKLTNVYKNFF